MNHVAFYSLSLLLLVSCATTPKGGLASINFDKASVILQELRNQDAVVKKFGQPSRKILKNGKEWWDYNEPHTGYQRVSLKFNDSKQLESVLWMPTPDEPESKLERILDRFPKGKFQPVAESKTPSHSIDTETTYSDSKSMTILHNDLAKRVEAIAWYLESDERQPARSK